MASQNDKTDPDQQRRRFSRPRRIGLSARTAATKALKKRGFAEVRVATRWPEIVGENLAGQTLPEKLSRGRDGGTLTLRVSGAAALELTYLTPQLIERINTYFGFRAVARLHFVQGPIPQRPKRRSRRRRALNPVEATELAEMLTNVRSNRLKSALTDLGHGILTTPD